MTGNFSLLLTGEANPQRSAHLKKLTERETPKEKGRKRRGSVEGESHRF